MKVCICCMACAVVLWPMVVSAELYKWTDDQGSFHITDTPPPAAQKKSVTITAPAPRSASPKKARVRPILPGQPHAEVQPVPTPIIPSVGKEVSAQRAKEGLNPNQATLTSSWQIFDSAQINAKAPVQWWKDQQGLDHFVDVLPKGGTEVGGKIEDVSASRPTRRAKERSTGVSHSRHQATE